MKSTEQLASRFLRALQAAPKESNQWSTKSAEEICESLRFSNEEWKRVIDYMWHDRIIEITKKNDSFTRVRIGAAGESWLSKNGPFWTYERRNLAIIAVLTLIGVFLAWLEYRKP
jgi:hypothetical protein